MRDPRQTYYLHVLSDAATRPGPGYLGDTSINPQPPGDLFQRSNPAWPGPGASKNGKAWPSWVGWPEDAPNT